MFFMIECQKFSQILLFLIIFWALWKFRIFIPINLVHPNRGGVTAPPPPHHEGEGGTGGVLMVL